MNRVHHALKEKNFAKIIFCCLDTAQTYCNGGRHHSNTNNVVEYEKRKLETNEIVVLRKGKSDFCGRNKSQIFTTYLNKETKKTKLTKGQRSEQKRKCKNNHSPHVIKQAWCDLYSKGVVFKLHDMCSKPDCNFQKHVMFSQCQFEMEGSGSKISMKKVFKGSEKAWSSFFKPAVNTLAPVIGTAVGATPKNPEVGQAATKFLKIIS